MGQNGLESNRVNYKKGLIWFGSKRVRVRTGPGQNGFRVGSGPDGLDNGSNKSVLQVWVKTGWVELQTQFFPFSHNF
ncbi:hypothetical protein HanPI659440_Chr15g0607501 [Helianthus annuus]|nr:hypothetical protein HanPI659440_Chr15g0607501 [Helianthus annuus]